MRRTLTSWFVLLGTSLLSAQDPSTTTDPLVAGKQRLATALQKTAALNDVGFTASWGPDKKNKKADDDQAFLVAQGRQSTGKVSGSWHPDSRHVGFEDASGDELWNVAGRTIARDNDRAWCVRKNKFADGNPISFEADIAALVRLLATMDLAVVNRSPGSIDDKPVEIVTVTLNPDQVTELARGEHVPDVVLSNPFGGFAMFVGGGAAALRPEAQKPTATVDLAIAFDPGTSLVQELRFRSWMKDPGNGRNFVVRGGAGAVRVIGAGAGGDDDEEDEEGEKAGADKAKTDAAADAPMQYENGLPVRPRKKTTVTDFTVRLTEHGTRKTPELDDAAKKLLGR